MRKLLQQPFPSFTPSARTVALCLVAGGCVFFVLFVLGAFGMHHLRPSTRFYYACMYALATFVVAGFYTMALPVLLPPVFREEKWTVGKEIIFFIWLVGSVGIANLLVDHWLEGGGFSWANFGNTMFNTAAVGLIPVTLTVLVKQQKLLRRYAGEARRIEETVFAAGTGKMIVAGNAIIELAGEKGSEKLQLAVNSLLYINAADNYVKIYHTGAAGVQSSLLRSSLKNMELLLEAYPQFCRCHRAWLVNLQKVVHISGNAQGYRLHLAETEDTVPVSRNLNTLIGEKLAAARVG